MALDGRGDEALLGYRDALGHLRAIKVDLDLATATLDAVRLLGANDSTLAAAAEEARVVFDRVGARPYLELLQAAMDQLTTERPVRADPPSSTVPLASG